MAMDDRRSAQRSSSRGQRSREGHLPVGSAAIGATTAEPYRYTMADLEQETGITGRTIRYYITEGLLPPAKGRGVGATYSSEHLLRLKAIAALKRSHAPLSEIRERLEGIREADLAAMLQVETAPPEDRWRRVHLHPDLELHVRERGGRDRDYALEQVVDTIVKQSEILIARDLGESR
jgi:DNA-binding transcriptional MerR regulator